MSKKLIALLAKYAIKACLFTCGVTVINREIIEKAKENGPVIIMLWHNRLSILAEILLPLAKNFSFAAFISKSRDGEILSQFTLSYPSASVIRVAHNGKDKALKAMIETLKNTNDIILITPDGPRGPAYEVKPGIVFAAKETGAAIIPFSWDSKHYWSLNTWDKFRLPRPFSKIRAAFGNPIYLDKHEDTDHACQELQHALDSLTH